jgi:glycine oxidase
MTQIHSTPIDTVVIGGGIAGLACARELADTGRNVVVFEAASGRGASWAAAGMLSPWAEEPDESEVARGRTALEMREQALAIYPSWVEGLEFDTGMPIDMDRRGSLVVSFPGEERAAVRLGSMAARAPGFRALEAEEVCLECPLLDSKIRDGVLLPEEGYADPQSIMVALREACRIRGVIIEEDTVLHLIEKEGTVRGVRTALREARAATVVNAAGAWATPFLGGDTIRPIRGQLVSLRLPPDALRLTQVIQSSVGYLVPRADGSIVVGATSEDVGFETGVTKAGIGSLLDMIAKIAPALGGWTLERTWSGFRPYRNGGPLIASDETRRGLYHVAGLYRHGILLAPYAAWRIRELVK